MQVMANRITYSLRNATCTCVNSSGSQYILATVPMTFRNGFFICPALLGPAVGNRKDYKLAHTHGRTRTHMYTTQNSEKLAK